MVGINLDHVNLVDVPVSGSNESILFFDEADGKLKSKNVSDIKVYLTEDSLSGGNGISLTSGVISADINATNLKFTANQINTIQDIAGTSSPTFQNLNLTNTGAAATLIVDRTDGKVFNFLAGVSSNLLQYDDTASFSFATNSAANIRAGVSTGFIPTLTLAPSGNVGIGTTSPTAKLELSNTAGGVGLRLTGAGANVIHSINQEYDINYTRTTGSAIIDFRALPNDGTSGAQYRFGISSGSTGEHQIILFEPSSTTQQAKIATSGQNTFFCSQGGRFGIGTQTPAASALLELSSTTGALLLTRMTTTERDALTPVNGMIIYNVTANAFNFRENGVWVTK